MSDSKPITSLEELAQRADYSLLRSLRADPEMSADGRDHHPRQVRSGHYVLVAPTPLPDPEYVTHSHALFEELGLSEALTRDEGFRKMFSADLSGLDLSGLTPPLQPLGWATGYALSIYGTEYTDQCPFKTGNGYGDGRALSVFEGVFKGQRWECQLKGSGPTPYCRGGDGRAVLRSSVREFLAQELMHALGVPTTRSLTLYASRSETVKRPWYTPSSRSFHPDVMLDHAVAISTRVAPSFLRVGQLELFARRARSDAHPEAREELRLIVEHVIERNYARDINRALPFEEQLIELARCFKARLTSLVAHWMRVGYCQGNFNSDNCAVGGYTLDYGPFGFCELFDPHFQPWTGGGRHFSFFNQPAAAEVNFHMFCASLTPLLTDHPEALERLEGVREGFAEEMTRALDEMWAQKLGLPRLDLTLLNDLFSLMARAQADYTRLFRALSELPSEPEALEGSCYQALSGELKEAWGAWLGRWRAQLEERGDLGERAQEVKREMKRVNPNVTWREWLIAPAYQRAEHGDDSLIHELQEVLSQPYDELSPTQALTHLRLRPQEYSYMGGVTHYSCSS